MDHEDAPKNDSGSGKSPRPRRLGRAFFLVLLVGISILFILIARSFLIPVFLAAITVGLFHPLHKKIDSKLPKKRGASAAASTVAVILIVIIPLTGIGYFVVENVIELGTNLTEDIGSIKKVVKNATSLLEQIPLLGKIDLSRLISWEKLFDYLQEAGAQLLRGAGKITGNIAKILLLVFIYLYCLYFFFKDGADILSQIFDTIPMKEKEKKAIAEKFVTVTRATIKGTFIIGLIQGGIGGVAIYVLGLKGAVVWGVVLMFLSIIPNMGAVLVWLPAAIVLFITGRILNGILMILIGGGLIAMVDYLLRPRLIGDDISIHQVLILIGVFGGIALFGIFGFLIGPIIMALFVTLWDLFGKIFREE